jgi:signal recognition particle GTPase
MSFIERAESQLDEDRAKELERKLRRDEFTFEDFLDQMKMMRRMGPLQNLLGMIPGMKAQMGNLKVDEKQLDRIEAIVLSMTPDESGRRAETGDAAPGGAASPAGGAGPGAGGRRGAAAALGPARGPRDRP